MNVQLSRRDFFASLAIVTGAGGLWDSFANRLRRTRGIARTVSVQRRNSRRRRRPPRQSVSSLEPGLYLNPRSQIVHFVSPSRVVCSATGIDLARLQPATAGTFASARSDRRPPSTPTPHVNGACASVAFEWLALDMIARRDFTSAADLLLIAVGEDAARVRAGRTPSLRLYDLLAIVSVRFGQPGHLDRMRAQIASMPSQHALRIRESKWTDPQSAWHRKWRDTTTPRTWAHLLM